MFFIAVALNKAREQIYAYVLPSSIFYCKYNYFVHNIKQLFVSIHEYFLGITHSEFRYISVFTESRRLILPKILCLNLPEYEAYIEKEYKSHYYFEVDSSFYIDKVTFSTQLRIFVLKGSRVGKCPYRHYAGVIPNIRIGVAVLR
jgi:hypothetical protein